MGLVNVSLPVDGTTADVADYNVPLNTIVNTLNGNIDSDNVSTISSTKITKDTNDLQGWISGQISAPNTVAYNGNRSYTLTFNSTDLTGTVSPGMRIRTTRTVSAPTQCTSLNGTTQYYSRTSASVTGMTFTDDFVVSAWIKLTSYPATTKYYASRYNGTSGWGCGITSSGQVVLNGFNGGAANYSQVVTYQAIPLNKWVHIAAQLDMSSFTNTTTTSYIMLDGINIPCSVARGGTNPTALVQAGNLEIGSANATDFFPGKLAQVAIFNAKVTQATIQGYISQGLSGTETSLISAYSFNNSINDLNTTNANNLTAQGSAVATNADSPFATNSLGTPGGSYDYGIVTSCTFSTNTTMVVQVPEGNTIPTSGGVAAVVYSTQKAPYGMPVNTDRWIIEVLKKGIDTQASPVQNTWYNMTTTSGITGGSQITVPIGSWVYGYDIGAMHSQRTSAGSCSIMTTLSTANNTESDSDLTVRTQVNVTASTTSDVQVIAAGRREKGLSISAATTYYLNTKTPDTGVTQISLRGDSSGGTTKIYAIPSIL